MTFNDTYSHDENGTKEKEDKQILDILYKITVFWNVIPSNVIEDHSRLGGMYPPPPPFKVTE
jgi:hypothetical protein